jgi:hypothetical protein
MNMARHEPSEDPDVGTQRQLMLPEEVLLQTEAELSPASELDTEIRRTQLLVNDAKILEFLKRTGLAGPKFDMFYKRLAVDLTAYAYPIMFGLIKSSRIFKECQKFRKPVIGGAQEAASLWTPLECQSAAVDSIVGTDNVQGGLDFFKRYALQEGHWDPTKGASIGTYFVGSCVCCFSNICNEWWKRKVLRDSVLRSAAAAEEADPLLEVADRAHNPAELVVLRDDAAQALSGVRDPKLREVLKLRAMGWPQADAATEVGLTPKAAERRLHTHRKHLRGNQPPNNDDSGMGRV